MKKPISILIILFLCDLCFSQCNYNMNIIENITPECSLPGGQLEVVIDPASYSINNTGMSFYPDTLFVAMFDTISVSLGPTHNMVQVDSLTWFSGGVSPLLGGFNIPFGGSLDLVFDTPGIYYYICQPHVQLNMKGVIVVGQFDYIWLDSNNNLLFPPQQNNITSPVLSPGSYQVLVTNNVLGCSDTLFQTLGSNDTIGTSVSVFSPFNINPVNYNIWSMCVIRIDNLGCEVRLKPEFNVSHQLFNINQGDFVAQYLDPQTMIWKDIQYSLDNNGNAIGFWGDTLGTIVNFQNAFERYIRVKFSQSNPLANLGIYTANMRVWECDQFGNLLHVISDTTSISLNLDNTPCAGFTSSLNISDVSCHQASDGLIDLNVTGGTPPYSYQWSNGLFSQDISGVHADTFSVIIQDSDSCFLYDTAIVNQPFSNIPNIILTEDITTTTAVLKFSASNDIDYYRFRYREVGFSNWNVVGLCFNDGLACLDSSKQLNNLYSNTYYEWQIKVFSLDSCISNWSDSHFFNTTCFDYDYNIIYPTCVNQNGGSVDLNIFGNDNYSFLWSTGDTTEDVYSLMSGVYYVDIFSDNNCFFSDTFFISNVNPLILDTIIIINPSCYGDCDGQIIVSVNGGSSPYIQNWGFYNPAQLCAGNYYFEITDANGCVVSDSVFVDQPDQIYFNNTQTICNGHSVIVGNNTYDTTGTYTDILNSTDGCDSIVTTDLSVLSVITSNTIVNACDSYDWNGATYIASGSYNYLTTSSYGCDSIAILDLTINNSSNSNTIVSACNSYDWNGTTYTSSGSYNYLTTSSYGCDSIAVLDLIINTSNTGVDIQTACDSYIWIDGNNYISDNNSATYTIVNSSGCDSIVTLNLTLYHSVSVTNYFNICFGDSIIVNNNIYDSSGVYTDVLTNINGCDSLMVTDLSVIFLQASINQSSVLNDLTVLPVPPSQLSNYTFIWNTGDTSMTITPQNKGVYWAIITDNYGCISDTAFYNFDFVNYIDDMLTNDEIIIYPNPANHQLNIILNTLYSYEINIIDNLGRIRHKAFSREPHCVLDVSDFEFGSYYLRIISNNKILNKKLIIN